MITTRILLATIENVKRFVNTVSRYDCDVDLISGKYQVDGKSIMGIFSLDLSQPITMQVEDDEQAGTLLAEIDDLLVKGS